MTIVIEKGPSGRIRGLRHLLSDLTREDVLGVLLDFTLESVAPFGFIDSTDYDLVHEGKHYPPKAILGLAAKRVVGRVLAPDEFAGGEKSACFAILGRLNFDIRKKLGRPEHRFVPDGLVRYQQYGRESIATIFEPGSTYSPGTGKWGIAGIVETPSGSKNFVFMVTLGKPHVGNPYRDELTEDGFLIWESQTRNTFSSPVIQKLLAHDPLKHNIHLFLRPTAETNYTYLGLLQYFSHDPNCSNPVHFIWNIRNWDLDRNVLTRLGFPYRAALDPAYSLPKDIDPVKSLLKVDPPNVQRSRELGTKGKQSVTSFSRNLDWAAQDERNRNLGLIGEKLVLQYETETLKAAKRGDLAALVEHVALYNSAAGFDILSFDVNGTRKRIEVKTTQGPSGTPFFISVNEVLASREEPESYWIYRVFDCDSGVAQVKFFQLNGDVEECCDLVAINFRAYPNSSKAKEAQND